jgi:hypothetical protein
MNDKDQEKDVEENRVGSLEHTDTKESLRQLRWTIGVTLIGLALLAFFYF